MSNLIDIRSKITNDLPMVQITDDLVVTVNNRKSTILNIQCLLKEQEKMVSGEEYDELTLMNKVLEQLISPKNVQALEELDLPLPEYKEVYNALMGAAAGTYGQTPTE